MDQLLIKTIREYNESVGLQTWHSQITVVDFSKINASPPSDINSSLYSICFMEMDNDIEIKYGRNNYTYYYSSLMFVAPGQIVKSSNSEITPNKNLLNNWTIMFHPDFIKGTMLGSRINDYDFFSYDIYEALQISESEKSLVLQLFIEIKNEVEKKFDEHSKEIITTTIDLLLRYSKRFYDRQYFIKNEDDKDILLRFEKLLNLYFTSDYLELNGIPPVSLFAEQLNLSPNYFGEIIKKETGITPKSYIHSKLMDIAKEKIFDKSKNISEISHNLGFKYPQHFMRIFKKITGLSPSEYRSGV